MSATDWPRTYPWVKKISGYERDKTYSQIPHGMSPYNGLNTPAYFIVLYVRQLFMSSAAVCNIQYVQTFLCDLCVFVGLAKVESFMHSIYLLKKPTHSTLKRLLLTIFSSCYISSADLGRHMSFDG